MTIIASPLATNQPDIPIIASTQIGKFPGLRMHFPTATAFRAAVTAEQANVAASNGLWSDHQPMSVSSEPADVVRVWSTTSNNARSVIVRPGLTITLAGDANSVLAAAGIPSSGTGTDGDISIDFANDVIYIKSSGAWAKLLSGIFSGAGVKNKLAMPGANDDFAGTTVYGVAANSTIAKWQAVGINDSGTLSLAGSTSGQLCHGVAVVSATPGGATEFLNQGIARHDAWTWVPGDAVWLSETLGGLTQTRPATSGDVQQPIGFALASNAILVNIGQGYNVTVL